MQTKTPMMKVDRKQGRVGGFSWRRLWTPDRSGGLEQFYLGQQRCRAIALRISSAWGRLGSTMTQLISVIENSGESFVIDEAAEAELLAAGLSQRVVTAIKATNPDNFKKDSGTTGGDAGGPGPAVGPEPLPAATGNLGRLMAKASRMAKDQYAIAAAATQRIEEDKKRELQRAKMAQDYQGVDGVLRAEGETDPWLGTELVPQFLAQVRARAQQRRVLRCLLLQGAPTQSTGLASLGSADLARGGDVWRRARLLLARL